MKFWGYLLGCWEALFSVLVISMEHAYVVQPGSLLFVYQVVYLSSTSLREALSATVVGQQNTGK